MNKNKISLIYRVHNTYPTTRGGSVTLISHLSVFRLKKRRAEHLLSFELNRKHQLSEKDISDLIILNVMREANDRCNIPLKVIELIEHDESTEEFVTVSRIN